VRINLRHPRTESHAQARTEISADLKAYALGLFGLLGWLALAFWLGTRLRLDATATALGAFGLGYGTLSVLRPSWYWRSSGISDLRSRFGERATIATSLVVCGILIAAGIYREIRLSAARAECSRLLHTLGPGVSRVAVYEHRIPIGVIDWLTGQGTTCLDLTSRGP
jgi:hypothetical protein